MTELNWDDLVNKADEASKPIPEGPYVLKVTKATWKPSKAGNPMMALQYRVEGGSQDGKSVRHWITLGDQDFQVQQFVHGFKAHGVDSPNLGAGAEILEALFIGKMVNAKLQHDGEYNGQPNVRVAELSAFGSDLTPPPAAPAAAPSDAVPAADASLTPPPKPEV